MIGNVGHVGTHGEFYKHFETPGSFPQEGYLVGANAFMDNDEYEGKAH